jgi:hypothetical protein
MPIIAIKDNPPTRYPNLSISETGLNWYIAKVKPRQEKALAFELLAMEVGYYLPLFSKSVRRPDTGKLRTSILPLFPSYLPFECDDVPEWLRRSDRVVSVMNIRCQQHFKNQLEVIYRAREFRLALSPSHRDDFEMGQLVKISDGPCQGLVGKLVKRINGAGLVLLVEGLGFAEIHVNPQHLTAL